MKLRRAVVTPLVVALLALGSGGWLLQKGAAEGKNVYANARLFEDVLRRVSSYFVDEKDSSELYRMAIDGMLEQLGDPHSTYLPADEYEKLRMQTEGEYGGLGVQIIKRGDAITVIAPLPGTPGERAGLRAGDAIIAVNDTATKTWNEDEAVSRLRGPKGSKVVLTVVRAGVDKPIKFEITREEIRIKSVPAAYLVSPDVGYVELVVFSATARNELRTAIRSLQQQGAKRLILDLRQNPGGLLEEGAAVTDMFLPKGKLIVETKSRVQDQNQKVLASTAEEFPGMPMVVLIGPGSASASEIVAGALQDHDRALLVGRTTYGKGSVQTVYPLGDNNWLKLTTARWYTPAGRTIQKPYGIGELHEDVALVAPGAGDSTKQEDRPSFKTDAGRTVYGGGGIAPDVEVDADSLLPQERVLLQALQQYGSEYATQRLKYAVEYIRSTPQLPENFVVTDAMVEEFYRSLQKAGVKVEHDVFVDAKRWVQYDLGYDIAYSKWGQQVARKRTNAEDPQVKAALELLRQAATPAALLSAGAKYSVAHPASSKSAGRE